MTRIAFSDGWKYRLEAPYFVNIGIYPPVAVGNRYIKLLPTGDLAIADGYCWDGPSGPTIDSLCFLRGSLLHDVCYQLIREGLLPPECRESADRLLQRVCLEDGMTRIRAWWVYQGVRRFGGPAASARNIKHTRYAPSAPKVAA